MNVSSSFRDTPFDSRAMEICMGSEYLKLLINLCNGRTFVDSGNLFPRIPPLRPLESTDVPQWLGRHSAGNVRGLRYEIQLLLGQ